MCIKRVHDKDFKISLPGEKIQEGVKAMAKQLNESLAGKDVVFLAILNGAFMFASDLLKHIQFDCKISFLKLASYDGDASTGKVKQLIGLNENLKNKTVVVLEDIVDTGHTLDSILKQLQGFEPADVKIACLLHKPEAFSYKYKLDFVGFNIPNEFIVGYGLDYNGYGRNLVDIYTLVSNNSNKYK